MIRSLLIANRGEIAVRVIRTCREMGIEAVAAYSQADAHSLHVKMADRSVCIGPPSSRDSYLNSAQIITAALLWGCEAIHPGVGFLAENPQFARDVVAADLVFIGPDAGVMEKLGDKIEAKRIATRAGIPVIPGGDGPVAGPEAAHEVAERVGYPVLLKAAAGGGGKGIRIVRSADDLDGVFGIAAREAQSAFGDGTLYVEKLIENPRHVEVQLLGDRQGNIVHLWERDCSLQRRHQKLVEESPSPHITARTRAKLCDAAVRLARLAGYYSAGTCEFLVDEHGSFYFIEVNARIQVEHPVTELVTGEDLVQWQIRIAAGEPLKLRQEQIEQRGCAIECRINAESPDDGFRPCPGRIEEFILPGGPGVRVDTHAHAGYVVSPYYDSMIAKLLVHRPTRAQAISAARRALAEFVIRPLKTTIPLHRAIMEQADFVKGNVDTGFIERTFNQSGRAG
jgi:acetyl-CoA carboxylase biotin carboxylase subunit